MSSNIVHQYFKKDTADGKILVKVNPIHWKGVEIFIPPNGSPESRALEFDADILDDLAHDGFLPCSPLEFGLYETGLAG